MPIGKAKARQLLRGRKVADAPHDPHDTDAYESGWYALLVQHGAGAGASDEDAETDAPAADTRTPNGAGQGDADVLDAPTPDVADGDVADTGTADDGPLSAEEAAAARLAEVTILALRAQATDGPHAGDRIMRDRAGGEPSDGGPGHDRTLRSRSDPASIRIGVRRVEDPTRVYLDYLTASPHRDYFRADWWPASGPITPVHLWRANHLGAGWDVESIGAFMRDAAALADDLVAAAPGSAPAGTPERRAWQSRFVAAGWVREFGLGRVSKTLHPILPELVADLDPAMMVWARRAWFGLDEWGDAEDPDLWLEIAELLEDVLVLRGQPLGQIARRLRRSAPGIAPVSRLGPVLAAFWDGYWTVMATPTTLPAAAGTGTDPTTGQPAAPAATPTEPEPAVADESRPRPRPRAKRATSGKTRPRSTRTGTAASRRSTRPPVTS
jgi:hypothetical protein